MNTPTKQTVYIPVEITEEFWTKWDNGEKPDYDLSDVDNGENIESWVNEKEGYFFTPEQLNEYTQSVIKQALENAAENAAVINTYKTRWSGIHKEGYVEKDVHKQSITNTFEETYKKFKV